MADEHTNTDNENTQTQQNGGEEAQVTMSQEQLNSLINGKYAKGAEKATNELLQSIGVESVDQLQNIVKSQREAEEASKTELEKANETINTLNSTIETLNGKISGIEEDNKITSLAAKHGIQEIDYFKFQYNNAKGTEDFNEESWINTLLETKGDILKVKPSKDMPNPPSQNNQKGVIRRADFEKMSPADKAKAMRDGKKIID